MNRIQAVYRDGRIQIIGQINGQIDWPNGIAVEVTPMEQPRATTEWQEGYFDDTAGALAGEPFESLDRG